MKSIFIKSTFFLAIFFSVSLLKAQVAMPDSIEIKMIYLSGFAEFSEAFVEVTGSVLKSTFSGVFVGISE